MSILRLKPVFILREILVNLIFYKLKLRKILRIGENANISKNPDIDIEDKGPKHVSNINESMRLIKSNDDFKKINISFDGTEVDEYPIPRIHEKPTDIPDDFIKDKDILEIGPGGTLLSGLNLLLNGCKSYTAIDFFPSKMWGDYPTELYKIFLSSLETEKREIFEDIIASSKEGKGPLRYFGNGGIEGKEVKENVSNDSFDFIYSWGVLEHVPDPLVMFKRNKELIREDGSILHVVDPHPHTWRNTSKPYSFLGVSNLLWDLMYKDRGFINRLRKSQYISLADKVGFRSEIIKELIDDKSQLPPKSSLIDPYASMEYDDLLCHRFWLYMRK